MVRHLDTCRFETVLIAEMSRTDSADHAGRQVVVPWAEANARVTALFEALVIDRLNETSRTGVSSRSGTSA